jgi:hypothetical protein
MVRITRNYLTLSELNIVQNIGKSWIFVAIFFVCAAMQAIIVEFGGYFGFSTHGLTWAEWLISIGLGLLSLPLGFVLRFIPMPKSGFMGFEVPDLGTIWRRIRGSPADNSVAVVTGTQIQKLDDIMAGPAIKEETQTVTVEMDDFMSK